MSSTRSQVDRSIDLGLIVYTILLLAGVKKRIISRKRLENAKWQFKARRSDLNSSLVLLPSRYALLYYFFVILSKLDW